MEQNNTSENKLNKKKLFGDGSEPFLWGLMIALIAGIGFLGQGPIGSFLQYITIYLFGAFYFLVYLGLIFFGVYLMVKRRVIKTRFSLQVLGAIFVLLSCLIASSFYGRELVLSNFASLFTKDINLIRVTQGNTRTFEIVISDVYSVGGGFIGYLFAALFNTTLTSAGTVIVYVTLMILGLVLFLKDIAVYLVDYFRGLKYRAPKIFEGTSSIREKPLNRVKEDKKAPKETSEFRDPTKIVNYASGNKTVEDTSEFVKIRNQDIFKTDTSSEADENIIVESIVRSSSFEQDYDTPITAKSIPEKETPYNPNVKSRSMQDAINASVTSSDLEFVPFHKAEDKFEGSVVNDIPEKSVSFNEPSSDSSMKEKKEEKNLIKEEIKPQVKTEISSSYEMETSKKIVLKDEEQEIVSPIRTSDAPKAKKSVKKETEPEKKFEEEKPLPPYIYPPIDLLKNRTDDTSSYENIQVSNDRLRKINELFQQFNIGAQVINYNIGPSVTRFNVKMNPGVKVSTLTSIQNEIAVALGGNKTVRIQTIVEGQDTSAIEIGNVKAIPVSFRECVASVAMKMDEKDKLLVPIGKDISGNIVNLNIDELPHLLVAGTTGSGKSVFINTIITTLIMRNKPEELKLMLIDPKKVEFSKYNGLAHLLCPVITEAVDGKEALNRLVDEMERRYTLFLEKGRGATKLSEYAEVCRAKGYEIPPSIVMVCDEFSDFMTEYKKEIETSVKRLAQKARAAGIYLIICTQRPSVNVITGDIKAVIPSRIGLSLPSSFDSKTILDEMGAETLLGNGDMLARLPRHNSLVRVQGSYVSTLEVADIVDFISEQREVHYDPHFLNLSLPKDASMFGDAARKGKDELHEQAKEHVMRTKIASTSNLQSKFGIGYARADHILYCLEEEGIVKRVSGNRRIVVKTLDDDDTSSGEENE